MVTSLMLGGGLVASAAAPASSPDFKEIYELLRTHLPTATAETLNQEAVLGLLAQLNGQAVLTDDSSPASTNALPVNLTVLDQNVGYLRLRQITGDLAARLTLTRQTSTNSSQLAGTVLDLRFASGDAYDAVKATVALLVPDKKPLLVLINGATSGAAEVLASELHDAGALLLGNPTAGLALTMEDFTLTTGQHLRVATTPVKIHGQPLARVQPDISIKVGLTEERIFQDNPYAPSPADALAGATNNFTPLLDHTSEAELVRQKRKDGEGDDTSDAPAKAEPMQPYLHDPVLARAVDLIKGLAVVRENRP